MASHIAMYIRRKSVERPGNRSVFEGPGKQGQLRSHSLSGNLTCGAEDAVSIRDWLVFLVNIHEQH